MPPKVTVQDASPSPPPLPNEPLSSSSSASTSTAQADIPIASLGEDDEEDHPVQEEESAIPGEVEDQGYEEEEEEWDPAAESLPGQVGSKNKGKGKASEGSDSAQPWQAVWAPDQNAWYFWNAKTGEVTWTNPLEPPAASSSTAPPLPNEPPPLPAPAPTFGQAAPQIDPALAYLLPGTQQAGSSGAGGGSEYQTASFNARSGRFNTDNNYSIDHLDEYNRMKRMGSHYFDVEAWEREKAEENAKRRRDEELGLTNKKKISKKDMERFKKKKTEQKLRSQAWLRD